MCSFLKNWLCKPDAKWRANVLEFSPCMLLCRSLNSLFSVHFLQNVSHPNFTIHQPLLTEHAPWKPKNWKTGSGNNHAQHGPKFVQKLIIWPHLDLNLPPEKEENKNKTKDKGRRGGVKNPKPSKTESRANKPKGETKTIKQQKITNEG